MTYDNNISRKDLVTLVTSWAIKTFGADFKFRPKQKETVVDIIYSWLNGTDNVILDAPTGSGKSIVAMIVAGVLADYFGKRGYILISDLSLLEQYQNDISIYLPSWAVIRGQQTYTCIVNGLNFNVGVCKLKGCTSYSEIASNFADCAPYCEYIVERQKAMSSPITVCTYSFWLMQQNYVRPKFEMTDTLPPFEKRDFVICDEAHKLVSIVQNQFSPKFGKEDERKLYSVVDNSTMFDKEKLKNDILDLRMSIQREDDNSKLKILLENYHVYTAKIAKAAEEVKRDIGNAVADSKSGKMTKTERMIIYDCEFAKDHNCKFEDYVSIINKIGPEYIVKNDSDNDDTITFNCLNESYLMHRAFHSNCGNKLYMSATIGDPKTYARDTGFSKYNAIKLPIVFDYTNSPIFFVPDYRMSYNEKETSFPRIVEMIEGILKLYPNYRGIIQTGSYTFAKQLVERIDPQFKNRLLLYEDSAGKQENLETYKFSTNKILIGPSLIEGLSLNDDLCRFQIIMKIPYPSLADKFISAKQKFCPSWYSEATSISMLQGVGRGVRNEKDWCVTFILDGCFRTLLNTSGYMFPPEFINRIQLIPGSSLMI